MNYEIYHLINKIENIIKDDKRFIKKKEYKFKNKIQNLTKTNNIKHQSIDITPLLNLAKLNITSYQPQQISYQNNINLDNIYNELNYIDNKIVDITGPNNN